MRSGFVTLTTDFGLSGGYVGAMKGALLRSAPDARLVDLTHAIPPHDVREAARVLASSCPWFPEGTVHVAVVDPGVGTARAGVVVRAHRGGHVFVGPDNGIFQLVLERLGGGDAHRIARPDLLPTSASPTFHGRDVFAPLAGQLTLGFEPRAVGPAWSLAPLEGWPVPRVTADTVVGDVVAVDAFGNLVTNLSRHHVPRPGIVRVGGRTVDAWVRTYGEAPAGARLVALFGSDDWLEVASPSASAASLLGLGRGASVTVSLSQYD